MNRKWIAAAALALTGAMTVGLAGCAGGSSGGGDDKTLRIAMGSPGEAQIAVWESSPSEFEAANEGWKVDLNYQDDDMYQTIGLPNLLNGRNAPDIYFEWVGNRLLQRNADGFAADLTEQVEERRARGCARPRAVHHHDGGRQDPHGAAHRRRLQRDLVQRRHARRARHRRRPRRGRTC